ncbi:Hydrogenase maturation factor HoxQ domain-containing protein [Thioalkalivibrio nitratireducens DSM 14787]|uniref:Hydrogenase maturation factor HoxQ domain-containing protein n=1 Tax=Thioalkalivibrio nitratireducens (strain DSM 14787 / UNIQEM 213 / ALEN2) TaxID=1255043 RepID=L0DXE2_THIND|nr:hydrogenase expression/formation protein [Thioalkalivibrio nitratireducens]AGA33713.1 Hydrogenase maturation factor HoxQ domain-containing protein [Thioalkalivibrio nitratireducens DSM 14787]
MSLKDIPVKFEGSPNEAEPGGMALALLREIADHLSTVVGGGERQVVELGNLPLSEVDRELLRERLGRGEVEAKILASGLTEVYETAFPGVWWVKYFHDGDHYVAEQIEIGAVPMILETHAEDIRASAERFTQLFEQTARNQQ